MNTDRSLRRHIVELLTGEHAHTGFDSAVENLPPHLRGVTSVAAFRRDLRAMVALVEDESTDLFARIPHGTGQTILREALLTADHNAYHVGQLILVRRLLGAWG